MRIGSLKLKLQLSCGDLFALGPGKADLLEAIEREGSISAGARAMGMSYRRAWLLVDEMNRCFTDPAVRTLSGGGRERGARLSDTGREALRAYRALEEEAARLADSAHCLALSRLLRASPLPVEEADARG
jgi:molybdate transport system regulatory protein